MWYTEASKLTRTFAALASEHEGMLVSVPRRFLVLSIISVLLSILCRTAQGSVEFSEIGQWGGECSAVAASGDRAYAGMGRYLAVFDLSHPASPVKTGAVRLPDSPEDIALSGEFAYVTGIFGLRVVNISDPEHPMVVGSCPVGGSATSKIVVTGAKAYVAGKTGYTPFIQVIDISDPTHPTELVDERYPEYGPAIAELNGYIYTTSYAAPLAILDTASGVWTFSSDIWLYYPADMAASGDRLFVVGGDSGAFDITDPTHPAFLGYCPPSWGESAVAAAGDKFCIADKGLGIRLVEASGSGNPRVISTLDTPDCATDVAIAGDHAFVADGAGGLIVADISDTAHPSIAGDVPSGWAMQMGLVGSILYIDCALSSWTWQEALLAFDESTPGSFRLKGGDRPSVGSILTRHGSYWLGVNGQQVSVIDISGPSPSTIGSYTASRSVHYAIWQDRYAFLLFRDWGECPVEIVDMSNPAAPVHAGEFTCWGVNYWLAISGNYVYAAESGLGVRTFDVSDPTQPKEVGSLPITACGGTITASGHYLYTTEYGVGIDVIDVTDPTVPRLAGTMPIRTSSLFMLGDRLCASDDAHGLLVFDTSDPVNPVPVGHYPDTGIVRDVLEADGRTYIMDWTCSVAALKIEESTLALVYGWIRDSAGNPVGAANVVVDTDGACAVTDQDGFYLLYTSPGVHGLEVSKAFWKAEARSITVPAGASVRLDDIVLDFGAVRGHVRDDIGHAVERATVGLGNHGLATGTDADGFYSFEDVVPGAYPVHVYAPGYEVSQTTTIIEGSKVTEYDIILTRLSSCTGVVRDNLGRAIQGIRIEADDRWTGTDANGRYELTDIHAGEQAVTAEGGWWGQASCEITTTPGGTATADFTFQVAQISGTVTRPNGDLVPGADITLREWSPQGWPDLGTVTDENGHYFFADVIPARYTIRVTGHRLVTVEVFEFEVWGGRENVADVTVNTFSSVSGIVRDKTGQPLEGIPISHGYSQWDVAVTDSTGHYKVDYLIPSAEAQGFTAGPAQLYGMAQKWLPIGDGEDVVCGFSIGKQLRTRRVGRCPLPGSPMSVAVQGDYAYLACKEAGLQIVDVSNPEQPVLKGACSIDGNASQLSVSGDYAYVAAELGELQIVDVSDPAAPSVVGRWNEGTDEVTSDVTVAGNIAFVGRQYKSWVWVVDVSDPRDPRTVRCVATPEWATDVIVVSGKACVVSSGRLWPLDVDIPDYTGDEQIGCAEGLYSTGGLLYTSSGSAGLRAYDCSSPPGLQLLGQVNHYPDDARSVVVQGQYAYLACMSGGIQVADVSNPTALALIDYHSGFSDGAYYQPLSAFDLAISGPYIYVANYEGSLIVLTVDSPRILSVGPASTLKNTDVQDVTISGYGFKPGATVKLTRVGQPDVMAMVASVSPTEIICRLGTYHAAAGRWNLHVTNPDGLSGCLTDGFSVVLPEDTRPLGASNACTGDPIMIPASGQWRFVFWGKVQTMGFDSFVLDDGAGAPVRVVAPGYSGISTGDYACATGTFDPLADPTTLISSAVQVRKLAE